MTEKKLTMGIKTINQIIDYVEGLARVSGWEALESKCQKIFIRAIFAFHSYTAIVKFDIIEIMGNDNKTHHQKKFIVGGCCTAPL